MRVLSILIALCSASAVLAGEPAKPAGTLINFSVESSQSAANDLARASAFAEATDAAPGPLAKKVNAAIAQALAVAKAYPTIKTRSGSTWTNPNYAKGGRSIESWRMRSELQFETRDIAALSELLGKLQANLGISQINLSPAPETRRKAEEEATHEAVNAFVDKAKRIAALLGKSYRIKQMNIGSNSTVPVYAMARSAMLQAEAAPMPIESGESNVNVNISGEIELAE